MGFAGFCTKQNNSIIPLHNFNIQNFQHSTLSGVGGIRYDYNSCHFGLAGLFLQLVDFDRLYSYICRETMNKMQKGWSIHIYNQPKLLTLGIIKFVKYAYD